uniref:Reverse transcriptase domain-containing protein n=1 Tax=Schistocephalus solidus TaxID=70667 RepID=A0A183SJ39_SCHSO
LSSRSLPNRWLSCKIQQPLHSGIHLFQLTSLSSHHRLVPPQQPPADITPPSAPEPVTTYLPAPSSSSRAKGSQPLVPQPWCLFLQAVNTTFLTRSLSLDIGRRRLVPWVFVVVDLPCEILSADFLAAFDIMVDYRYARLRVRTINPYRQFIGKHLGLTRPNFSTSTPPNDVVHHIQTTGLLCFLDLAVSRLHDRLPPRPSSSTCFEWASSVNLNAHGPRLSSKTDLGCIYLTLPTPIMFRWQDGPEVIMDAVTDKANQPACVCHTGNDS